MVITGFICNITQWNLEKEHIRPLKWTDMLFLWLIIKTIIAEE
jgi:hypothetical protein